MNCWPGVIQSLFPRDQRFQAARGWLEACAEAHAGDQPPSLIGDLEDVPGELDQLVRACLAKRADDRPTGASAVVQSLLRIYEATHGESYARPAPSEIQPLADGLNNQGVSLVDLGRERESRKRLEAALVSDPHHPESNYNLGLLRWRKAEITDTTLAEKLREVCASHSDKWVGEYLLAQVHLEAS